MNPGPAASTFSNKRRLFSWLDNLSDNSLGFNFRILAATIQTFEVM